MMYWPNVLAKRLSERLAMSHDSNGNRVSAHWETNVDRSRIATDVAGREWDSVRFESVDPSDFKRLQAGCSRSQLHKRR